MPATQLTYGGLPGQLLLAIAIVVGATLFLKDALRLYRLMRIGGPARRADLPWERTDMAATLRDAAPKGVTAAR